MSAPAERPARPPYEVALVPAVTAAAALAAPQVALSPLAAALVVFAGGASLALAGLVLGTRARLGKREALVTLAASALALLLGALGPSLTAPAAVNTGLVLLALATGGFVGRRIQHPGHLLPACAVAAAADLASVLHPAGPSRAIASSERALSLLAVAFPVPGTRAAAPVLGFGDLAFSALVFGACRAHRLGVTRSALAVALGIAAAGAASAVLGIPVPALVPIAALVVALVPAARDVRPEDTKTTRLALVVAAAVVAGLLFRAL